MNYLVLLVAVFSTNLFSQGYKIDTTLVNILDYSQDFVLDLKYATHQNFLNQVVYDCEVCLLDYNTAQALIMANQFFIKKGYKIKLFDCYRPHYIQKKMWMLVPNPKYVANPEKGSIHNRGGAIDLTLVDKNGVELDMGTPFDFFGIEASHSYKQFSKEILRNREFLKRVMKKFGFISFESEWWHYHLKGTEKKPVLDFKWRCD